MKRILLFIGISVLFLYSCCPDKSGNGNSHQKPKDDSLRVNVIPEPDELALAKIERFYDVLKERVSTNSTIGQQIGLGSFDASQPLTLSLDYNNLERYCEASENHTLVVYPVIRSSKFDLLVNLVDLTGSPGTKYFNEPNISDAENYKVAFNDICKADGGKIAKRLLPDNFYAQGNHFYSTYLNKDLLLYWLEYKKVESVQLMPALSHEVSGNRYISVIIRAKKSDGSFVASPEGYTYFNMTLPCPPPKDCR